MRLKKLACALALAAAGTAVSVPMAAAAPPTGVTVTPTVIAPDPSNGIPQGGLGFTPLQITGGGVVFGDNIFFSQCFKTIADPTFDPALDCDIVSGAFTSVAPGATTFNFLYRGTFRGDSPSDIPFACAEPGYTSPNAYTVLNTCFIRITTGSPGNTDNDTEVPVTFSAGGPGPVIPEAPYAALLPLGALAVLGGGYLVLRNRRSTQAA